MPKPLYEPVGASVIAGMRRDNVPGYAKVIYENGGLLTLEPILAATFAGKQYFYSAAFTLSATTDTADYLFVTPDTSEWAHMIWRATGSAITEIKLSQP